MTSISYFFNSGPIFNDKCMCLWEKRTEQYVAQAQVENSFKLIALKGLLEYQLPKQSDTFGISEQAIRVMNLMDSLL